MQFCIEPHKLRPLISGVTFKDGRAEMDNFWKGHLKYFLNEGLTANLLSETDRRQAQRGIAIVEASTDGIPEEDYWLMDNIIRKSLSEKRRREGDYARK